MLSSPYFWLAAALTLPFIYLIVNKLFLYPKKLETARKLADRLRDQGKDAKVIHGFLSPGVYLNVDSRLLTPVFISSVGNGLRIEYYRNWTAIESNAEYPYDR